MRYFLDTEFIEDGERRTIDLISIGIAAEDGRTYYAISLDFDPSKAGKWIETNVLKKLPHRPSREGKILYGEQDRWKTRAQIKEEVTHFIGEDEAEFWGYFADYDWVAFCWLFGKMIDLPKNFPLYCRDIKQMMESLGVEDIPFEPEDKHSALADAVWNRRAFEWLTERAVDPAASVSRATA